MHTTSQHNERHDEQHNAPHNSEQSIRLPRRVITVLIAALAAIILTGCSTGIGVAGDRNLQGIRTQDGDSYTGGYKADYSKFTGEEAVFGGTGKKASIHLNGTITGTSGTGRILVTNGSDTKRPVPATNGKIDQTYNVAGTSFYIYVTGDQFTGTVNLTSKEQ